MRQERITQFGFQQIFTAAKNIRIEVVGVRHLRANGPVFLIEFRKCAPAIARLIGWKIERSRSPDRPVQKPGARFVCVGIVVDEIGKENPSDE